MDEKELIEKIAAQDHSAFKELVDRYQDLVINTCYSLVGSREDSEDIAQQVFFQVYKSAEKFRGDAKISTWLYRIAVNCSLNFIRDKKRPAWLKSLSSLLEGEHKQVAGLQVPDSERPDVALEKKEQDIFIQDVINSLPAKQKAAFVLHQYEGLSYQEIAKVLHKSLSSIESLIYRAKSNLQKTLIHYLQEK